MLPQSGDAGGPVLDDAGAVLGMLLPDKTGAAQILPEDVKFTVTAAEPRKKAKGEAAMRPYLMGNRCCRRPSSCARSKAIGSGRSGAGAQSP